MRVGVRLRVPHTARVALENHPVLTGFRPDRGGGTVVKPGAIVKRQRAASGVGMGVDPLRRVPAHHLRHQGLHTDGSLPVRRLAQQIAEAVHGDVIRPEHKRVRRVRCRIQGQHRVSAPVPERKRRVPKSGIRDARFQSVPGLRDRGGSRQNGASVYKKASDGLRRDTRYAVLGQREMGLSVNGDPEHGDFVLSRGFGHWGAGGSGNAYTQAPPERHLRSFPASA